MGMGYTTALARGKKSHGGYVDELRGEGNQPMSMAGELTS
jgi:hypothetical protein